MTFFKQISGEFPHDQIMWKFPQNLFEECHFSGMVNEETVVSWANNPSPTSLVPRLSWNMNMYRVESLVSFERKHDVIKIG